MFWGYLGEFWNAITSVGDYTIQFFQNIGNAVAGAIGNLFNYIIQSITDIFNLGGWLVESLGVFFSKILLPVRYVFGFLKGFIDSAFINPPDITPAWNFGEEYMAIFKTIPYWDTLCFVLGIVILLMMGIATLKQFTKL